MRERFSTAKYNAEAVSQLQLNLFFSYSPWGRHMENMAANEFGGLFFCRRKKIDAIAHYMVNLRYIMWNWGRTTSNARQLMIYAKNSPIF